MIKPHNSKKNGFLDRIPKVSIESANDTLTKRCKFNFSYMDFSQSAGQKFQDWTHEQLSKLLDKLYFYSKEPLKYWKEQKTGIKKKNSVLEVYDKFPLNSNFTHPKHVPHEAKWARFRLEYSVRLIGFVLPSEYDKKEHPGTGFYFDCNTFYVVFLDIDHDFYQTPKK